MSSPPSSIDYYILREWVGSEYVYSAYVNGTLLSGLDAKGNMRTARVPASSICWNADQTDRQLAWFGEAFNIGDSLGGWNGNGTKNHLDYNPLK